jgi:hypothetical protein
VLDFDDWSAEAWRARTPQWACHARPGERCMDRLPVERVVEAVSTVTRGQAGRV